MTWKDILKAKAPGRKIHLPITSTVDLSAAIEEKGKGGLLPNWVRTNVTHEWKFNVSVQYNILTGMFRTNTEDDKLLLASWYLRSYIPKINAEFKRRLGGEFNPFSGEKRSSAAPFQVVPIKSITGKVLTYVFLKYNKQTPEINFMALIPNPQHQKARGADVMDLGNGRFEANWENNEPAKTHFKTIFGAAEIGETEEEPAKPETTIGDVVSEEDKKKLEEGLE